MLLKKKTISFRRTFNCARVGVSKSYSIKEIVELFHVHENTIFTWMKEGLTTIDDKKPFLFHGLSLKQFLQKRQAGRKSKCLENEFFCFRCKKPVKPFGNMVDVIYLNDRLLRLKGICEICEGMVNRNASASNISSIKQIFECQEDCLKGT